MMIEYRYLYVADPKIPISKVPCHGCGSLLQCADTNLPGYLPSELMRNRHKSVLTVIQMNMNERNNLFS